MDQSEKIVRSLDYIANCLTDIQDSINSISMPDFHEQKSEYSLFPDLLQDLSMYQNFDWSSINTQVMKFDRFGATVVLCKGNIFKREIAYPFKFKSSQTLEVCYKSCHKYAGGRLITFKNLEINEVEPVDVSQLPFNIALTMEDSLSAKEIKILIEKVNEEIKKAEQNYDLNQAAELKYATLTRLEERLKILEERPKNKG